MKRYVLKEIEGAENAFDIELNGYKTRIRKIHLADRIIPIPESFVCVLSTFSTKQDPLILNNGIPTDIISKLIRHKKRFYISFINTNPKVADGKKILEKDIPDPGYRYFGYVCERCDKYDDFLTGICSDVKIFVDKNGKIDSYIIDYVECLTKRCKEYNNSIYVDWRWYPERFE